MSTEQALHDETIRHNARLKALESRVQNLENEVIENAKFRQKMQWGIMVVFGLATFAAAVMSIATSIQGFAE